MLSSGKKFLKNLLNFFGYKVIKYNKYDPIINKDENFSKIYKECKNYTMTSKERMYALYKATEYIIKNNIREIL